MNSLNENFIEKIGPAPTCQYLYLKRFFDIAIASLLIIVTAPIVIIASFFIKATSEGPILYRQSRVGENGHIIIIAKLRSMYIQAEKNGAQWAKKNDPRVTSIGKFIRKTRIDELPQLFNVIKGDMSLIGPRPERPEFTLKFSDEYEGFQKRLRIKPGLSGYAQVHGGYDLLPNEKAKLDNYYIDHISFLLDIKITIETIMVIFSGEGAR